MCSSLASPTLCVCLFLFLLRVTFITSTATGLDSIRSTEDARCSAIKIQRQCSRGSGDCVHGQTDTDPGLTFDPWLTGFQVVQLDGSPVYPPCGRVIPPTTPPPPPPPTVKPTTAITTKPYRVVDIDGSPVNHYPSCRVIPEERQHPDRHLTTRPPPSQATVKAKTTTRTTTVNRIANVKQPLFAKTVGHPLNHPYPRLSLPLLLANSRPALSRYDLLSCFRLPAHWLFPGYRLLSKPIGRLPRQHSGTNSVASPVLWTNSKRNKDLVSLLMRNNRQSVLLSVPRRGQTHRQNIVGSSSEEGVYRTGLEPLTLAV